MDFFAAQELRHRKTKWLVMLYVLAVTFIILGIYAVVMVALGFVEPAKEGVGGFFDPAVFAIVAVVNLIVIGLGSLYKTAELRAGGQQVASLMGGTRVPASTTDLAERRLLNVVEEMALASGVSVPPVYIMNHEPGINAFAAGYSPADAVIGVNRGTVEQLNRDELQGVIAHEFSHILNGDMRMNIRLSGSCFGIQILAMIGYFVLRSGAGGRRSQSDDGKGAGAILVIALAFLIFGSIGQFFARMIKASISRQREYLADASAVQFTRYPEGLGGALKMIGGSTTGSVIQSEEAEELSHMFFANGLSSKLGGFLSTHPPLVNRILKLDKQFDGNFRGYLVVRQKMADARAKRLEKEDRKRKKERTTTPIAAMFPKEVMERFSIDPDFLIAAIGDPNVLDVDRSRELIGELPEAIAEAARHPYSARCVAFAMLLSEDSTMLEQQSKMIRNLEGQRSYETTMSLLKLVARLPLIFRLPLMEMIQGSLSDLSPQQYTRFRATVESLVKLDNKTSLFEFVVRHHLLMHLDRRFELQRPPTVKYKNTRQLAREIELMLSAFASASITGSVLEDTEVPSPDTVQYSYRLAMQVAGFGDAASSPAKLMPWEVQQLEDCMQKLQRAAPAVKKQFLESAAVLITYDHEITTAEAEFFRAVAESLDCPVPVFAAGRTERSRLN